MTQNQPKKPNRRRMAFNAKAARKTLVRLTLTSMFIAIALAVKSLSKLPLSSLNVFGIQVSFGGIFTFFPAILFGPLYGGIASGMVDFVGAMVWPTGTYIPWLTLTAFAGGFIKGCVWKLITGKGSKILRYFLLLIFILVAAVGISFGASLSHDGVIGQNIFSIKQEDLPTKGEMEMISESGKPLSKVAVGLARYNKDTFTLKNIDLSEIGSADSVGKIVLPSHIELDGAKSAITKLNLPKDVFDKLFEDGKLSKLIVEIPADYKNISDSCFRKYAAQIEIHAVSGSNAAKFVNNNKDDPELNALTLITVDKPTVSTLTVSSRGEDGKVAVTFESGEFTVTSSDSYRKYLAQYLNLAVSGFIIGGVVGILFIGLTLILDLSEVLKENKNKRRHEIYEKVLAQSADENSVYVNIGTVKKKKRIFDTVAYMRILMSILASGLFVTTVNTFILRIFVDSYNGRLFTVLWIPRVCEEIVVCVIQAYIISLIYSVVTSGRLGKLLKTNSL